MDRFSFDTLLPQEPADTSPNVRHDRLFRENLLALWRRRRLIAATLAAGLMIGLGVLAVLPKEYSTEAMVQLDLGKRETMSAVEQGPSIVMDANTVVQSEAKVIRSRMIAERVVRRINLEAGSNSRGIGLLRALLSPVLGPPDTADPAEKVIAALMSHLTVETDTRSYLISVIYRASDPRLRRGSPTPWPTNTCKGVLRPITTRPTGWPISYPSRWTSRTRRFGRLKSRSMLSATGRICWDLSAERGT